MGGSIDAPSLVVVELCTLHQKLAMLLYPRAHTHNSCPQLQSFQLFAFVFRTLALSVAATPLPALSIKHFVMAAAPSELTVSALNRASGDQLKFWIQGVNDAAGKRVLNKSGKVEDLRTRLATHFGLNRTAPVVADAANGPLPLDKHIQKQQWDHLRQLGHEWAQTARAGREFKLCTPSKGT